MDKSCHTWMNYQPCYMSNELTWENTHALQHTATHCNALLHTATHCCTLQRTAAHCCTLQYTAAHYNTLQHTATHYITLQHTAIHLRPFACLVVGWRLCQALQHTATHCSTLQHTGARSLVWRKVGISVMQPARFATTPHGTGRGYWRKAWILRGRLHDISQKVNISQKILESKILEGWLGNTSQDGARCEYLAKVECVCVCVCVCVWWSEVWILC